MGGGRVGLNVIGNKNTVMIVGMGKSISLFMLIFPQWLMCTVAGHLLMNEPQTRRGHARTHSLSLLLLLHSWSEWTHYLDLQGNIIMKLDYNQVRP